MKTKVFFSSNYEYLAKELTKAMNWDLGQIERKKFPDGEKYQKIVDKVFHQEVVLVGGTISDEETLELYDLACALSKYGANKLTIVIPFYGYSTMERAAKPGEVVPAKSRARLLSTIPQTPQGNEIVLLDLHTEGIPYYFEGNIRVFHLYAKSLWLKLFPKLGGKDYILASTDAGRAKWVESLANDLKVTPAFVYKQRLSGNETKVTGINAEVSGKVVIIYDDMIRTGGSLIKAAEAYKNAGAKKIIAVSTHGVFPEKAYEKLKESKLFDSIWVTNSHPKALVCKNIVSIIPVLKNFFKS